jgi:hypothetical protein
MARKKTGSGKKAASRRPARKKSGRPYGKMLLAACAVVAVVLVLNRDSISVPAITEKVRQALQYVQTLRLAREVATWDAVLYFADEDSTDVLISERRKVTSGSAPDTRALALMQELIKGPHRKGYRTLPEETEVRSAVVRGGGLLTVDFSGELRDKHPGGSSSELLTVFSIVNTLAENLPAVRSVQITIQGRQVDTIAGHIDCARPLSMDRSLIR